MEKSEKFSDYLFAKMGPPIVGTAGNEYPPKTTSGSDAHVERTKCNEWFNKNLMLLVTLSGVVLGVVEGFSLRSYDLSDDTITLIAYPGELFMRLLKLLILPLIISSLISGSASLNARMNGKIALRTLIYFVVTSLFNAFLGICLVLLIRPGAIETQYKKYHPMVESEKTTNLLDSLLDLGRNIIPDNLFQASFQQTHTVYVASKAAAIDDGFGADNATTTLSPNIDEILVDTEAPPVDTELIRELRYRNGTNTLGIVFFCLVFGTMLGTIGSKGQVVIDFFTAVFEVVMKMVTCVMWLTPIGISSVIAGKILSIDDLAPVMMQLMWFIITVAIGVFFYQWIVIQLIYFVIVRKNPFKFYYGLMHATLMAFATASAAAALPITFRCMNDKLGIDPRITRFVLPIGININMDGTALFISIASIFIAQMANMSLGFGELVTVLLTSTAASMSSASVPSAALVLLLVVLTAIDAPVNNVTLLFAIDWLVDRIRTTNNMLGDCYASAVVEELSKKELMALDAAYQGTPETSTHRHIHANGQTDFNNPKCIKPEAVIVEMNNSIV